MLIFKVTVQEGKMTDTLFWACFNPNSQGTYLKAKVADLKVLGMLSRGHKDGGQEHLWSCRALARKFFGEKQTKRL